MLSQFNRILAEGRSGGSDIKGGGFYPQWLSRILAKTGLFQLSKDWARGSEGSTQVWSERTVSCQLYPLSIHLGSTNPSEKQMPIKGLFIFAIYNCLWIHLRERKVGLGDNLEGQFWGKSRWDSQKLSGLRGKYIFLPFSILLLLLEAWR